MLATVLIGATTLTAGQSARADLDHGPRLDVPATQLAEALSCPAAFTHPGRNPVLLVHGTTQTAAETWGWNYLEVLPRVGFDTCALTLPDRSLGDMQVSSEYVVHAVRTMAARAASGEVDLVGHSQGVEELRWAVRWWPDVAAHVERLIGLAGPDHGTSFFTATCAIPCWPSAWQETPGSRFMTALNTRPAMPGIDYTMIYSRTDQFVEPEAPGTAVPGAGLATTSPTSGVGTGNTIAVQDLCPGRVVDHIGIVADAVAYALVTAALESSTDSIRPARIDRAVCQQTTMPGVDRSDEARMDATLYTVTIPTAFQRDRVSAEPPLAGYARG